MKQDMLSAVRKRDQMEISLNDLRSHISVIEKKNNMNESLLLQTVNK